MSLTLTIDPPPIADTVAGVLELAVTGAPPTTDHIKIHDTFGGLERLLGEGAPDERFEWDTAVDRVRPVRPIVRAFNAAGTRLASSRSIPLWTANHGGICVVETDLTRVVRGRIMLHVRARRTDGRVFTGAWGEGLPEPEQHPIRFRAYCGGVSIIPGLDGQMWAVTRRETQCAAVVDIPFETRDFPNGDDELLVIADTVAPGDEWFGERAGAEWPHLVRIRN